MWAGREAGHRGGNGRDKKGKTIGKASEDLGEREGTGWEAEDQGGRRGGARKSTGKQEGETQKERTRRRRGEKYNLIIFTSTNLFCLYKLEPMIHKRT